MITFKALLGKSGENGWTYVILSKKLVNQLKPDAKLAFRVKGKLDNHVIQKTSLLPIGQGRFMLPFNAGMRKATGKKAGDTITLSIELDERKISLSRDLLNCLKDDPEAMKFFKSLAASHQRYYSKWIEDAKTTPTKTKRITITLMALNKNMNYADMLQAVKTFEV